MSELAEALRIVGEYAQSKGGIVKADVATARWCELEAKRVEEDNDRYSTIVDQLARGGFVEFEHWSRDQQIEFGELCRREVERQFGPCQPLPEEKAVPS